MSEVADVLRRAVGVIDERGWCQGDLEDERGRCCAVGAIRIAAHGSTSPLGPVDTAVKAHDVVDTHLGRALHVWNDEPGRTVGEVRAELLAAAEASS